MPNYTNGSQAILLRDDRQMFLWNNETVAAGTSSIAVQLERVNRSFYPWGVSFEVFFGGAPGAFEVDIQTADTDLDSHYVTINSLTGNLNSSNVGRIELVSFWAKYVRAKLVALANTVTTSVLVTR